MIKTRTHNDLPQNRIEVALALEAINVASVGEKLTRHYTADAASAVSDREEVKIEC